MTQDLLTNAGEEWYTVHDVPTLTITVGVYNDGSHSSGDNLGETSDIGDVTTEPTNTNYARVSETVSGTTVSGRYGVDNDNSFSFNFSDVTSEQWVDTFLVLYSFQSARLGDGSSTLHLVANPAMSTDRDIGSMDSLDVSAGDLEITLD